MSKPTPKPGDKYSPLFESDFDGGICDPAGFPLTIVEVCSAYCNGDGFEILANDDVYYDCYWSERLQAWCYSLD